MKTLLLLRHGKSSWDDPALADHERPLKKRGRRDAPRMGRLIAELDLAPGLILSSTATRARATAEAVATAGLFASTLRFERRLYESDPSTIRLLLRATPESVSCVMVVGHEPEMGELVFELGRSKEPFPTSALAWIELSELESWAQLDELSRGKLRGLYRPKEL